MVEQNNFVFVCLSLCGNSGSTDEPCQPAYFRFTKEVSNLKCKDTQVDIYIYIAC